MQVVSNDIVRKRHEIFVFTFTAFDFGFLTNRPDPLIPADRLEASLPGALAFEASWVDIFPSSKQRPKKGNFMFLG